MNTRQTSDVSIVAFWKSINVWIIPVFASILLFISTPYVGEIQKIIAHYTGKHSDKIIFSFILIFIISFMGFAFWKLRWKSPDKYLKFFVIVILYFIAIRYFQNPNKRVRVIEVIHFIEYGVLSFLFYKAFKSNQKSELSLANFLFPVIIMSIIGVLDESIQWIVEKRTGEIRDVMVNIVAGLLPQILLVLFSPFTKNWFYISKKQIPILLRGLIGFTVVISIFFAFAHLGFKFKLDNTVEMVSHFTQDQLREINRNPLITEKIIKYMNSKNAWNPENYYVSEAKGHEGARNKSYDIGRLDFAYRENEILETCYEPYLNASKAWWEPEKKEAAFQLINNLQVKLYRSPVGRQILFTGIDPRIYWIVVVFLVFAITKL
ncbi:MAG: hypothetical protein A2161_12405 [Candidatus Schekmanbacteria bacterium RBG_13_48_7]|uniref:VanZ-like domain-containing protein n=1 Tax=Candidatus Schekmanbacteria bacterium RBG_13_48_7 TaxID=1817878 RepID=A0A1F7RKN7_9BACT|nr:MAG: hypothetical protein A2161_12405 [Candidatus Schekmanbacteria bacterium RBG_13_48_7]